MTPPKKNSSAEILDEGDKQAVVDALMRCVRGPDNRLALRAIGKLLSLEARNQQDSDGDATA